MVYDVFTFFGTVTFLNYCMTPFPLLKFSDSMVFWRDGWNFLGHYIMIGGILALR